MAVPAVPLLSGFVIQALYVSAFCSLSPRPHLHNAFCDTFLPTLVFCKQTKKPGGLVTCRARTGKKLCMVLLSYIQNNTVVVMSSAWEGGSLADKDCLQL